ncbi:MAG: alanine dehydrogenase [Bacteroidales bacterium]|nr:alanine dehydrogenase [Bacteroidales bacterium]
MPEFSNNYSCIAQEEIKKVKNNNQQITIGMLCENENEETRVPLTPMAVDVLSQAGITVKVQRNAGKSANYSDIEYNEAGAIICDNKKSVFDSDIVIKTSAFSLSEIDLMKPKQIVISFLGIAIREKEYIQKIMDKKVIAIAMEYIKSNKEFFPIAYSHSEIVGRYAISIAEEYLGHQRNGKGILIGGITGISPTSVVIIGTGTAALVATKTADNLGAEVKVFDNSLYSLLRLEQKLGKEIFTSILHPQVLKKALKSADVVIGARDIKAPPYPVVTEEMISCMKKGSIIVDLNIETGSCFETSKPTTFENPTFEKNGVIHYCLPNIGALVPRTSSIAISNVMYPIFLEICRRGSISNEIRNNSGLRNGIYTYMGILTNNSLGKKFKINSKDINLFLGAM